jgi:hypothetical protein
MFKTVVKISYGLNSTVSSLTFCDGVLLPHPAKIRHVNDKDGRDMVQRLLTVKCSILGSTVFPRFHGSGARLP